MIWGKKTIKKKLARTFEVQAKQQSPKAGKSVNHNKASPKMTPQSSNKNLKNSVRK